MKFAKVFFVFSFVFSQTVDGIAIIVEDRIIMKSDVVQMINMAAVQNKVSPEENPEFFSKLKNSIIESMLSQKILLEMAEIDSIVVDEKEVDNALEQQIQNIISQAGGESRAEEILGQSIKDFRREFWFDMRDRLLSEKYQQGLLASVSISRSEILDFYKTYKDSLPIIPTKTKIRHLLIQIVASQKEKEKSFFLMDSIKKEIKKGQKFETIAKQFSQDPGSKNNGGLLGWVKRGSLVKNFETAAFTAKTGELVGPIETEFGFHILETIDKKGEKIKVRHILSIPEKTQKDNERAFNFALTLKTDSIKTIDDFKKAVKRHTADEKTKKIGGDLGWIDPNNYIIPEIGQSVQYIEMNSCSPPINSSLGFHLLWIEGVKKGGKPNLENHWTEIESFALNKKKLDWFNDWIKKSKETMFIKKLSLD